LGTLRLISQAPVDDTSKRLYRARAWAVASRRERGELQRGPGRAFLGTSVSRAGRHFPTARGPISFLREGLCGAGERGCVPRARLPLLRYKPSACTQEPPLPVPPRLYPRRPSSRFWAGDSGIASRPPPPQEKTACVAGVSERASSLQWAVFGWR